VPSGYLSAVSVVGRSSSRKTERAIFFQSHRPLTQPRLFTAEVVTRITELHLLCESSQSICEELGIRLNTYQKALAQRRLVLPQLPSLVDSSSSKSERNLDDDHCSMGKSCRDEAGRIQAARMGKSSTPAFGNHLDLGVSC
jgi:hypothetical protein